MEWEKDPIGKDCINLNTSLARWLSDRLKFMYLHTTGWRLTDYFLKDAEGNIIKEESQEEYDRQFLNWRIELDDTSISLKAYADMMEGKGSVDLFDESGKAEKISNDAKKAIQWVADNFNNLWD